MLVLTYKSNREIFVECFIEDDVGNKLIFNEKGYLIKTVSGLNSAIAKTYIYSGNQLTEIYDERKSTRKIKFEYNVGGLLSKMSVEGSGTCKSLNYTYGADEKLLKITKSYPNEIPKESTLFSYDGQKNIICIVSGQDKSALEFQYNSEDPARVTKVCTGTGITMQVK